jgi:hypothetical protein
MKDISIINFSIYIQEHRLNLLKLMIESNVIICPNLFMYLSGLEIPYDRLEYLEKIAEILDEIYVELGYESTFKSKKRIKRTKEEIQKIKHFDIKYLREKKLKRIG